jgi:hypothetical protein
VIAIAAAGCPAKQGPGPTTGSQGSGGGAGPNVVTVKDAKTCEDVKPRVEQLYRAEALQKEPKRVDEATADNTSMVMRDCAKDPARYVPCLASVPTVAELEKNCLVPLDDEGTEGEAMRK